MLIESASSLLLADRVTSGVEVTFLALVARQSKRCSLLRGRHESSLEIVYGDFQRFASLRSIASLRHLSETLHAVSQTPVAVESRAVPGDSGPV
ncbi:hypothetical protein HID58_026531 [Brassica napus]|uniref:Uncharacterized protein n=1 Tax=Brassica napus TaxID=3708 RepID=A0ABQ8CP69_BRANA|nr:hypothetical protein HID58_026531 [Brassica napus]